VRKLGGEIDLVRTTMSMLATTLTRPMQRKVVDETGLGGGYSFAMKFDRGDASEPSGAGGVFAALKEQLGWN